MNDGRYDNALNAEGLERISALLEIETDALERARRLLTMLGDPGRRTVVERLSRRPQKAGYSLPEVTGMTSPDIHHRLRSLVHARFITRNRHHVYRVDPSALVCASRYIDTLMVAASFTTRGAAR